ncbi:MAG: hypothetical protein JSW07_06425, partial [bacterium]
MFKYLKDKIPKFLKNTDMIINEYESSHPEDEDPRKSGRDTNTKFNIDWVDEFVQKIKPYIYVREVDRLLILIP